MFCSGRAQSTLAEQRQFVSPDEVRPSPRRRPQFHIPKNQERQAFGPLPAGRGEPLRTPAEEGREVVSAGVRRAPGESWAERGARYH